MTESEAEDLSDSLPVAVKASLVNDKPLDRSNLNIKQIEALLAKGVTPELIAERLLELINYENPTINLKSLELSCKILGLLKEQVELSGNINISASLKEARSRVANYDASNN